MGGASPAVEEPVLQHLFGAALAQRVGFLRGFGAAGLVRPGLVLSQLDGDVYLWLYQIIRNILGIC